MKKMISLILLGLLPSMVFADDAKQTEKRPIAGIRVVDMTSPQKVIKGNKVSVSKKQDVCVILVNLPYQKENKVTYYFTSPKEAKFDAPNMQVKTSEDKKHFEIISTVNNPEQDKNAFQQCWQFNNSDPKGIYWLDVKINDLNFKGLSFEVIK